MIVARCDPAAQAHGTQDVAAVMWTIQCVVWSAEATFREMADSAVIKKFVCCLFSWRYNQLWLYFPQPGRGL
jgi:hypothetical protein